MQKRPTKWRQAKRQLRAEVRAQRVKLANKAELSRQICRRLAALPEYTRAGTVMFYIDCGSEVRTRPFLPSAWRDGKQIVVPYCVGDQLGLFFLESLDELAPGTRRILEPQAELRNLPRRQADVSQLDLVVVPGVAFDRRGGRLGQGRGYYDRFLRLLRPDTMRVALAFECQMIAEVPMLPQDVYMDKVISERAVYEAVRPRSAKDQVDRRRNLGP